MFNRVKASPSGNYLIRKHNIISFPQFKSVFLAPGSGREVLMLFCSLTGRSVGSVSAADGLFTRRRYKREKRLEIPRQRTVPNAERRQVTVAASHKARRIGDDSCTVGRWPSSEKAKLLNESSCSLVAECTTAPSAGVLEAGP